MAQLDVIIECILLIESLFTMRAGVWHRAFVLLQMIMHSILLFTSLLANMTDIVAIFVLLVLKGHCMIFFTETSFNFLPLYTPQWV